MNYAFSFSLVSTSSFHFFYETTNVLFWGIVEIFRKNDYVAFLELHIRGSHGRRRLGSFLDVSGMNIVVAFFMGNCNFSWNFFLSLNSLGLLKNQIIIQNNLFGGFTHHQTYCSLALHRKILHSHGHKGRAHFTPLYRVSQHPKRTQ